MRRYLLLAVGLVVAATVARAEDPLRLPVSQFGASRVVYTPDGTRLAMLNYTGEVLIWDTRSGKEVSKLQVNAGGFGVAGATFLNDGRTLAVLTGAPNGRGGAVRLHDVRTGKETARWPTKEMPTSLAESPDGTLLAVACGTRVRLFDTATGEERTPVSTPANETIGGGVGWMPDGKRLLFPVYTSQGKAELLVCEKDGGEVKVRVPTGYGYGGRTFAVTPDGAEVVTLGPPDPNTAQSKLVAYDLSTGKQLRTLGDRAFSGEFALTPDGKRFVAADMTAMEVVVGDVATGKVLASWKKWYSNGLDMSPDGNSFATLGTDVSNPNAAAAGVMRVRIDHLKK